MRKAFTLIEMVVALGILALVLSFAGIIFQVSIDSHRMALANAEIMQKLRVITEQLEADLGGLNKDGEIFIIWDAERKDGYPGANQNDPAAFERFDRIMFFATGDFQTYGDNPVVHGNLARICYTLANRPSRSASGDPCRPEEQKPETRILARTLHIL
ncbi:MAG: type II secretion system protein, partial [Sedimentisphaerales bacterium]|nr:type II secretion system protein [Sedimentisphaerales bacterium]